MKLDLGRGVIHLERGWLRSRLVQFAVMQLHHNMSNWLWSSLVTRSEASLETWPELRTP
jgi:hypothetical protein